MTAVCSDDAWVEGERSTAIVLYPLHQIQGRAAQVGFAVDVASQRVISTRILVMLEQAIYSASLDTLPACGIAAQPCRDTQVAVLPLPPTE